MAPALTSTNDFEIIRAGFDKAPPCFINTKYQHTQPNEASIDGQACLGLALKFQTLEKYGHDIDIIWDENDGAENYWIPWFLIIELRDNRA